MPVHVVHVGLSFKKLPGCPPAFGRRCPSDLRQGWWVPKRGHWVPGYARQLPSLRGASSSMAWLLPLPYFLPLSLLTVNSTLFSGRQDGRGPFIPPTWVRAFPAAFQRISMQHAVTCISFYSWLAQRVVLGFLKIINGFEFYEFFFLQLVR